MMSSLPCHRLGRCGEGAAPPPSVLAPPKELEVGVDFLECRELVSHAARAVFDGVRLSAQAVGSLDSRLVCWDGFECVSALHLSSRAFVALPINRNTRDSLERWFLLYFRSFLGGSARTRISPSFLDIFEDRQTNQP